jgi:hypothetical protein
MVEVMGVSWGLPVGKLKEPANFLAGTFELLLQIFYL